METVINMGALVLFALLLSAVSYVKGKARILISLPD
jgi:hypothetical protein